MRSERMLPLAALAAALVFSGVAFPDVAQAQVKIAVIDMQTALLSTTEGQKAAADLNAKFAPKQAEFQKRSQDLQAKQEQYRKTENTISDDAKAALARDIDTTSKALQRDVDDARADADQDQQKLLNELGGKMMQVLQKYANEKQLTLVLDVSGEPNNIRFASSTVDITRDIITMYNNAPPVTNVAKPSANITPSATPRPAAPKAATPPSAPPK